MKLYIHEVIVWPDNPEHSPRIVEIDPKKVGIVSGWSGTGKSSLIAIIDYVLGAGSTSIPVGAIRDTASWYGLKVERDFGQMRLAREKPGEREVSDAYWLQQGNDLDSTLPSRPKPNARTDRIKQIFDDLSKLSNLRTEVDGYGFSERASFRDMAAFNFQPQHIVANPYTMFFKADTSVHRDKLRNVIPLALGIISNEDLVQLHTRRLLRDELRRVELELKLRTEALERWRADATGAFYRAQELGLVPAGPIPERLETVVDVLRQIVESGGQAAGSSGRVSRSVTTLNDLRRREQEIDRSIADKRRRLKRLRSLRGSIYDYEAVVVEQKERVRGVGWFKEAIIAEQCVLCGSDAGAAQRALKDLDIPIAELEELSAGTTSAPPMIDRDIVSLEGDLIKEEQQLIEVRRTRRIAEDLVDKEEGRSQSLESVYRFIGGIEQALRMFGEVEGDDGFHSQVGELRAKILDIDRYLDVRRRREREERVANIITRAIQRFISLLGIVGADGIPKLDQKELNLRFERDGSAKPNYLWEVGSGENWMAYHLALMFALHAVFLQRGDRNPVPTLIVID